MAYVTVSQVPSRELYDSVSQHLAIESNRPAGLVLHAATELPSGAVQLVDVWESMADIEAFEQARLFPAFSSVAVPDEMLAAGRPATYEAFELTR